MSKSRPKLNSGNGEELAMLLRRDGIEYVEGSRILASNAYKRTIEDYAEKVADALKFEIGEPPDRLVERLGGRVVYENMDLLMSEDGSIFVHDSNDFDVLLPQYTSPRRDRFTIAHELGHYFLHSAQGEIPIIAYRQGSSRIEWEANWFAAALLMPAAPFRNELQQGVPLAAIAQHFGVSEKAADVRRKSLQS